MSKLTPLLPPLLLLDVLIAHVPHAGSSLGEAGRGGITLEGKLQLLAFCVFEGCVGVFWPSMMAERARFIPDEMRSTIINIFRIPLNLFVCLILFEVRSLHTCTACTTLLAA